MTGQDASLEYAAAGAALNAQQGAYSLSGQDVVVRTARRAAAASGGYVMSGAAAWLRGDSRLLPSAGGYALVGRNAALCAARTIGGASGFYTLTGYAAHLAAATAVVFARAPAGHGYAPHRNEQQYRRTSGAQARPAATQRNDR